MAQGKLKIKTKVPVKKGKSVKGAAVTKRANAPIKPKKQKQQDAHKLKQIITKTLNKAMEDEMRARAGKGKLVLSNAQQVVAKHNTEQQSS